MNVTVRQAGGVAPATNPRRAGSGHRVLPGIGDVVVESWAPTRLRCMQGAVSALLECEGTPGRVGGEAVPVERQVPPGEDQQVLTDVLQAVLEVRRSTGLPVRDVSLAALPGGGVRLLLRLGETIGGRRTPRRVSPQWVSIGRTADGWHCEAILDR